MRKLRIFIVLKLEHEGQAQPNTFSEWQGRNQRAHIVSIAAENLCEILALSERLTSIEIVWMDHGRLELTTGREPGILTSFGQLRRIKHVKITGVSEAWTRNLTTTMKKDK